MSAQDFVTDIAGHDLAGVRRAVLTLIGINDGQTDTAKGRHLDVMLEVSGLASGRLTQSLDSIVVRYLAPEAALYGRVDRARELLDEVDDVYYRAHGYRELFLHAHDPRDLSEYMRIGGEIDHSAGFRQGDGSSPVPLTGGEILTDGVALAVVYGCSDITERAAQRLSEKQMRQGRELADKYAVSKPDAHAQRVQWLSEGYF
jgi:hypothetical protein